MGSRSPKWKGAFLGVVRPVEKHRESLLRCTKKRLNRSRCRLGADSYGPKETCNWWDQVGRIHSPPQGVTRWRCGLSSDFFDHLLRFTAGERHVDLYASLGQVGHHGESFSHDDVWVMSPWEGLLKTRQLLVGERGTTSTLLAMTSVARLENYICRVHQPLEWENEMPAVYIINELSTLNNNNDADNHDSIHISRVFVQNIKRAEEKKVLRWGL